MFIQPFDMSKKKQWLFSSYLVGMRTQFRRYICIVTDNKKGDREKIHKNV